MNIRKLIPPDTWIRVAYRRVKARYFLSKEKQFMIKGLSDIHHFNCFLHKRTELLLITITYNNVIVLQHQLRLLPKYLEDNYQHVVVDNSSDYKVRKQIATLCEKANIGYLSLPKNCYSLNGNSHGLALNWAYDHLIQKIKPIYFGLLDHDNYPVKRYALLPILKKQGMFGQKIERGNIWYLWTGSCFLRMSFLLDNKVDFKPGNVSSVDVDTGGMLYPTIYQKFIDRKLLFVSSYYENIRESQNRNSDPIECFSINEERQWLHSTNGSYWSKVPQKEHLVDQILDSY